MLFQSFFLKLCGNQPILLRHKIENFLLSVADNARRYGLHAACGKALAYLCPENGADLIPHQAVENAARLLGVYKAHVDGTRALDGVFDRVCGDFVEHDAALAGNIQPQYLRKMPGNRLSLAVRVGGKIDLFGVLRFLSDLFEDVAPAAQGDILGLKAVVDVHPGLALGKIAHVTVGSDHLVMTAQKFSDGFGFRWRFHNDQCIRHLS